MFTCAGGLLGDKICKRTGWGRGLCAEKVRSMALNSGTFTFCVCYVNKLKLFQLYMPRNRMHVINPIKLSLTPIHATRQNAHNPSLKLSLTTIHDTQQNACNQPLKRSLTPIHDTRLNACNQPFKLSLTAMHDTRQNACNQPNQPFKLV